MKRNSQAKRKVGVATILILLFILAPILSVEETASPGALYLIMLFAPMSAYALMNPDKKIHHRYDSYAYLFWGSIIISAVLGSYGHIGVDIVKGLMFVVFFVLSTSFVITTVELRFLFKSCLWGAVSISVLIILSFVFGYPHNDSYVFMSSYSIGITGLYKNPNYLASFINIILFILLFILFFGRNTLSRRFLIIGVLLLFLVSFFFSGVRASVLTVLLSTMFVLFTTFNKKKRRFIRVALILGIIVLVLVGCYFQDIVDLYDQFSRSKDLLEDSERTDSWYVALKCWEESPIWGCGSGSWAVITKSRNTMLWLHNVFLELLLEQGLIGAFLLLMILFSGYKRTKREDRIFLIALMAVSGVPLFFQNGVNDFNFWRFVLINRVAFNYSIQSEDGIYNLITGKYLQVR